MLQFLADHADLFYQQGSVQASWRWYMGKRLGPFYRVTYRRAGKQHALYLGADEALAEVVRKALQEMQAPLRERRERDRYLEQARAALKKHKRDFDQELLRAGLYRKGSEIRGWRSLRGAGRPIKNERSAEGDHEDRPERG